MSCCTWLKLVAIVWLCTCGALVHAETIERVVSLAPNLTELTFAAGAGSRIKGTAEFSDEPPQARSIPRVGDAFRVDAERILALRPDVVLAWQRGTPQPIIDRLRSLGLNVREFDTQRLADVPRVVRELGSLMSTSDTAERAATDFETAVRVLRARHQDRARISVFMQVNTRPLYTVSGQQLISELIEVCGGVNVFAELGTLAPQVSVEAVIARNPDVIVSTDDGDPNALAMWRTWKHLEAVHTNNLYTVPANDLTRATTRLVRGAEALCRVLETARVRRSEKR